MRIAVTGASGFIARHLISYLAAAGEEVIALTRQEPPSRAIPGVTVLQTDYSDISHLRQIMNGCTSLVHLAGAVHSREKKRALAGQQKPSTETIAAHLWQAAEKAGCCTFIFTSSISVYGTSAALGPLSEDSLPAPQSEYAREKMAAELTLQACLSGSRMALYLLRLPAVYGPGMKGLIRCLFFAAKHGIPVPIFGMHSKRGFLSVYNTVRVLQACINGRLAPGLYLPHEPQLWTPGEFYDAVYESAHGRKTPWYLRWPLPRRLEPLLKFSAGTASLLSSFDLASRFGDLYGGIPLIDAREGIRLTVADSAVVPFVR
ncbi:MAG TPA: NAD-dependent epimerase/dehydratase family protein [Oligoflexia bacterium]|nr:NAD-dependent epimerase/dehydratase family protein [Oligoflexia bacterium]